MLSYPPAAQTSNRNLRSIWEQLRLFDDPGCDARRDKGLQSDIRSVEHVQLDEQPPRTDQTKSWIKNW